MTGGPQFGSGSHPSLTLALDFDPGSSRQVSWAIGSADSAEASFDLARRVAVVHGKRNALTSSCWTRVTRLIFTPAISIGMRRLPSVSAPRWDYS